MTPEPLYTTSGNSQELTGLPFLARKAIACEILERAAGVEPASLDWQSRAQPLYQARKNFGAECGTRTRPFWVEAKDANPLTPTPLRN